MYIPPSWSGDIGMYELAHYCQPTIPGITSTFFWGMDNNYGGLTSDGLTSSPVTILSNASHSLAIFDPTWSPDPSDIIRALRSSHGHYGPYTVLPDLNM